MSGGHLKHPFYFVIVFTLLYSSVHGRLDVIEDLGTETQSIRLGDPFGASDGFQLIANITVTQDDDDTDTEWLYFVVYTQYQYELATFYKYADPCAVPSILRFEFRDSFYIERNISVSDYFYPYLINCKKAELRVNATISFRQSDGELLSAEKIPLIYGYLFLLTIWFFAILWWLFLSTIMVINRARTFRLLTNIIVTTMFFQFWYFLLSFLDLLAERNERTFTLGTLIPWLSVISDALFLGLILLIGFGWSIVRNRITVRNKQFFTIAMLVYISLDLTHVLCNGTQSICAIYGLFFHVVELLVIFSVTILLNLERERLRNSFSVTNPFRQNDLRKLIMFHQLRWMFLVLLLVIPMMFSFFNFTLLSWQESWVSGMVRHCSYAVVFLYIAVTLRPRNHDMYFLAPGQPARRWVPPVRNNGENNDEEENDNEGEREEEEEDEDEEEEEEEEVIILQRNNPMEIEMEEIREVD